MIALLFKILILIVGSAAVAISYFHSKEAEKMERKMSIVLPGSIHLVMSLQLLLSTVFLFVSTLLLFIF